MITIFIVSYNNIVINILLKIESWEKKTKSNRTNFLFYYKWTTLCLFVIIYYSINTWSWMSFRLICSWNKSSSRSDMIVTLSFSASCNSSMWSFLSCITSINSSSSSANLRSNSHLTCSKLPSSVPTFSGRSIFYEMDVWGLE